MHLLHGNIALYREPRASPRALHLLLTMPHRQQLGILGLAALIVDHLGPKRRPISANALGSKYWKRSECF